MKTLTTTQKFIATLFILASVTIFVMAAFNVGGFDFSQAAY